ncbi:MAG: hypothetical protein LBG88_04605 [Christensenellaceae bacterium]|jgi:hypothetical protein|nr:hypothetical protein [Christensenellaceae bacterium]
MSNATLNNESMPTPKHIHTAVMFSLETKPKIAYVALFDLRFQKKNNAMLNTPTKIPSSGLATDSNVTRAMPSPMSDSFFWTLADNLRHINPW